MDQQLEHLNDAQVEHYGEPGFVAGTDQERAPDWDPKDWDQKIAAHLDECPSCRTRVLASMRSRLALLTDAPGNTETSVNVDPSVRTAPRPDCPSEDDLRNLAAGLCPPEMAPTLTEHAATCDHCGPILRMYTEDFAEDLDESLTPDERKVLGKLKSSSAGWQKKLVRELQSSGAGELHSGSDAARSDPEHSVPARSGPAHSDPARSDHALPWPRRLFIPAAAAACAAIAFFAWYSQRETPEKVEKLLAQAYTEQRTMEMRIPGAKYAPVAPRERGGTTREAPVLFDAKSIILRHLERQPEDWRWLRELGTQELLENHADDAIANLNHALQIKPDSTAVMIDLASAYFQRGRPAQSSADYRQTAELLGKVIALEPNNLVALFNRAVLYEEMSPPLHELAIEDWTNYLKLDPDGEWSEEAKHHKSELEKLKKTTLTSGSQESVPAAASTANVYDEVSLNDLLESWLPRIYSRTTSQPDDLIQSVEQRIEKLSASLQRRHQDPWLKEFYSFQSHPQFSSGAVLLARAIHENRIGNPDEGLVLAHKASNLFLKMHNVAGVSRADYEEVYALQRLDRSGECLTRLLSAGRIPTINHFSWLRAQFLLEKSTCIARLGDLGSATREAERGMAIAQSAGFEILALRALGMLTELRATVADDAVSWHLAQTGLKQFLNGNYPPLVGYQFYGSLGYTAENAGQWHLAAALNREAVILAAAGENRSIEAMARYRLGGDALMAGDMILAAREFERANALFSILPQSAASKTYRAYSQVVLAGVEARRQQLGRSRDLLTDSALNAIDGDDFVIQLSYYQTYGELQWKNGQTAEAEKALQSALRICDLWLAHLRDSNDRLAWRTLTGNIYRDLVELYSTSDAQPEKAFELWQHYRGLTGGEPRELETSGHGGQSQTDRSDKRPASNDSALEIVHTFHDRSLLTLVQFHDGLGLWLADDRGLSFHRIRVDPLVLERKIRHFRMLCAQRDSDQSAIQTTGKELFGLLISPFGKSIETRRTLLIDADSSLKSLPFPALVNEKGEYLVKIAPITITPGLEFERALGHRNESRLFQQNALILAPSVPPALANTLLPLKDAIKEAKIVAEKFPKHTLLLGSDAKRSAIEAAISHSGTFHFAGHAIFKNGQIGLVLADQDEKPLQEDETDRYLAETVKKGISSDLRLVVLAACSTANSSDNDLQLRGSLVEAFLQARVAHVVAAQWDIDSATTQVLMEKFYSDLAAGKSVAEALQGAQALVSSKSSTSHPYYWAGFEAAGGS